MQILNAVISSMGMHVGGSLQGGTGNADHMNSVRTMRSIYFPPMSLVVRAYFFACISLADLYVICQSFNCIRSLKLEYINKSY